MPVTYRVLRWFEDNFAWEFQPALTSLMTRQLTIPGFGNKATVGQNIMLVHALVNFVPCCCLPFVPQLACNILATTYKYYFQAQCRHWRFTCMWKWVNWDSKTWRFGHFRAAELIAVWNLLAKPEVDSMEMRAKKWTSRVARHFFLQKAITDDFSLLYWARKKCLSVVAIMLQASWGGCDKLEQEQTSPNHVQVIFPEPVHA